MKKSLGSQLASLRWSKEKPDPEYFRKISKLGVKKRKENLKKKYVDESKISNIKPN